MLFNDVLLLLPGSEWLKISHTWREGINTLLGLQIMAGVLRLLGKIWLIDFPGELLQLAWDDASALCYLRRQKSCIISY